ncbi:MAG TPA: TetR/AcrR family transcriptional regulator [Acidimicrobiales bacterium]|nr:TetR/AcrR family transcriptional regulator [Acidimicrobiales bacterium]
MIDTATRLRNGALQCIRARGLAATTSRHITAAAGVNLAGITYHFGSKDQLVGEALLGAIRDGLEPTLAILRRDIDPLQRMLAAFSTLEDAFEASSELLPIYVEALAHARHSSELRAGLTALFDDIHSLLRDQIADLKQRALLPEWVDPTAMASLHLAVADGLAVNANLNGRDPRAAARQFVALLAGASTATLPTEPSPNLRPKRAPERANPSRVRRQT